MKLFLRFLPFIAFYVVIVAFFYKAIFYGLIPFPGDILVSEYKPWQTYSYLGYNPGSFPNKAQYPDTIRQIYPWKTLAINQIKQWKIPLWNPYNFSGAPLLANFQSAVFYPFNILYLILPQTFAWTILILLQPFLSLMFTYGYIRTIGGSRLAAWFGAVSYAFSLFSTVWLEYNTIGQAVLWLPLILTAIEKMKNAAIPRWLTILVIAQACMLLAGHPQIAGYLLVFTLTYTWIRKRPIFKFVCLSTILALGLSAAQLLPGIEASSLAARSAHDFAFLFQKILIQPQQLLMMIIPNLFGHPATRTYWPADTFVGKAFYSGIIPLFFLLAAFRLKNPIIKFFSIAALAVLILMTANPFTFVLYKLNIPIFSSSSPTLMAFLLVFSLAVTTSLGLDAWVKESHSLHKLAHRSVTVVILFIILWVIFRLSPHAVTAQKAIFYSLGLSVLTLIGFLIAITRRKIMIPVLMVLVIIHAVDLFVQFQKFNPFVPEALVFPSAPVFTFLQKEAGLNRFWGYGSAAIDVNFATQYQLFSADGYDPIYPRRYGEFIGSSYDGKIHTSFTTQTRSDAVIAPGYGENGFTTNPFRIRVLNALGVKYILDRVENGSTSQTFPYQTYSQIYNQDGWKILENRQASPRIFLASSYNVFHNNQEFESMFFDNNFNPAKTVLLEEPLPEDIQTPQTADILTINAYGPNEVTATTKTDGRRILFISDTYYPGWKAFIDNKETKIYRANYAFRAVIIPQGEHIIRFAYQPKSFRTGSIVSLATTIIAIIAIGAVSLKRHEK